VFMFTFKFLPLRSPTIVPLNTIQSRVFIRVFANVPSTMLVLVR